MRRCDWFAADPANCQHTAGEAARSRDAKRNNGIRSKPVQEELEKFFIATDELEDKKLKFLGWRGTRGGGTGHQGRRKIFRERGVARTRRFKIKQPLCAVFWSVPYVPSF